MFLLFSNLFILYIQILTELIRIQILSGFREVHLTICIGTCDGTVGFGCNSDFLRCCSMDRLIKQFAALESAELGNVMFDHWVSAIYELHLVLLSELFVFLNIIFYANFRFDFFFVSEMCWYCWKKAD